MQYSPMSKAGVIGLGAFTVADAAAREVLGTVVEGTSPYWGSGEFMYCRFGGTVLRNQACVVLPVFDSTINAYRYDATAAPNTANLAKMCAISQSDGVAGQFGWFMISGITPVSGTASVAADVSVGLVAAGQLGAVAAGKQVLNARCVRAGSSTFTKNNCVGAQGATLLKVPDSDGLFLGCYLTGTGITAGTRVETIDPGMKSITVSAAFTAPQAGTVTFSLNNATIYNNIIHLNRSFYQGAIT